MEHIHRPLLHWYDRARRRLPWRAPPGEIADPYRVWLSEIMLRQTTVPAVIPYFERFTGRWPDVGALAAAPLEDLLAAWAGLGYYARARNLHRCASVVAHELGGRFPDQEAALLALPGIGPYTAAAIAAIAFDRPTLPVDGNVERVLSRVHAIETPLPAAKGEIRAHAARLATAWRPGDFAQAMMDLGATVCLPRRPLCDRCPLRPRCAAAAAGIAAELPRRAAKAERPTRHGMAFLLQRADGALLLRRRPPSGLLGGMLEVPSTEWRAAPWSLAEAISAAPGGVRWRELDAAVEHTFTHFHLVLRVAVARVGQRARPPAAGLWHPVETIDEAGLPSVMLKVARLAAGA